MACGWAFLKFDKDNSYWAKNKAGSRTTSKMWCWRTERCLASCNPCKWLLMNEAFLQCRAALLLSKLWLWLRQSCRLSPNYRSARLGVDTDACAKSTKGLVFLPLEFLERKSWWMCVHVCQCYCNSPQPKSNNCRVIVLILIEFSMESIPECHLVSFHRMPISITKSDLVKGQRVAKVNCVQTESQIIRRPTRRNACRFPHNLIAWISSSALS